LPPKEEVGAAQSILMEVKTILDNAVLSIQVGLEDLEDGSSRRLLSAARNLHAGILLLFKSKLLELSPEGSDEVLIKQLVVPRVSEGGSVSFVGKGKKTVDVQGIKERLENLGVPVDWLRLDRLTNERNNIEHYYPKLSGDALRGLVSDVVVIIRNFTVNALSRDPRELFGDEHWTKLIQQKDVFDAEQQTCLDSMGEVDWGSTALAAAALKFVCDSCGSSLMRPATDKQDDDDEVPSLECRSCGVTFAPREWVAPALRQHLPFHPMQAIQDGEQDPLRTCPSCFNHSFVADEWRCAECAYEPEDSECIRCGEELGLDEQDSGGICGYCSHMTGGDE
jgi:DNA-directed RNA polymerase subunit RPC12/RpoP